MRFQPLLDASDGLDQLADGVAEVLVGDDVGQGQADRRQLAGQELGVGLRAGLDLAIAFGLGPVAVVLAVLGQQDQRGGVGGLGREGQVQEDEGVGVPAAARRRWR